MDTFEQAFSDTESTADSTLRAATNLTLQLKALQKAARVGNISAINRAHERIGAALTRLRQEVSNASRAWPYQGSEDVEYLRTQYLPELRQMALASGLEILERDDRLISHPSIVRVLPSDKAVRIDRKQTFDIRPSHLVGLLLANQRRPARHQSGQFLEAIFNVYKDHVRDESDRRMLKGGGPVVPLEMIYTRLTYLPSSSREFDRSDFARSLYDLDVGTARTTKSGATVSFHASAGAKSTKGLFTFIGPDGRDVQYYAIKFTEVG